METVIDKYEVAEALRKSSTLWLKKYEVATSRSSSFVERPVVNMDSPRRVTDFKPGAVQIEGTWLEFKDSDKFELDGDGRLKISIMGPDGYHWVRYTYKFN
jgi:hypothetical protein